MFIASDRTTHAHKQNKLNFTILFINRNFAISHFTFIFFFYWLRLGKLKWLHHKLFFFEWRPINNFNFSFCLFFNLISFWIFLHLLIFLILMKNVISILNDFPKCKQKFFKRVNMWHSCLIYFMFDWSLIVTDYF